MSGSSPSGDFQRVSHYSCYKLDPTQDPRWAKLVERHPKASVFHTVGWLNALRCTYGYEPVAYTTSSPTGDLQNGLVFCRINSRLTGRRLVSLPFSDHCEPVCDSTDDLNFLMGYLKTAVGHQNWRYLEVRPIDGNFGQASEANGLLPAATYFLQVLDLRPDLRELFGSLDKDSNQRPILRAERTGLIEKCGRTDDLLKEFYALFAITRDRQQPPPAPYAWFRTLIDCLGEMLEIRVAYKEDIPISAILTLRCKDTLYCKYGCSLVRFNELGGIPWLVWRAIVAGKSNGAAKFEMGRNEEDKAGLLTFKNHWVSQPERLVYWRFPDTSSLDSSNGWRLKMAKHVLSSMPDWSRTIAGKLIYRHIG
jgi:Acetyltransferase (GNAT) domain